MSESDLRDEDFDELEVTCPLDHKEAVIQVQSDENPFETALVVQCSRFGDEAVTCDQRCLHFEGAAIG